jgi:hypothetical protein
MTLQPHDQHGPDIPTQATETQPWLDPQWRDFHKLWSMRVQFVLMGFTAAYMIVPAFISWMPPRLFAAVVIFLVFVGGTVRLLNQSSTEL